jgi:hypothetical protein
MLTVPNRGRSIRGFFESVQANATGTDMTFAICINLMDTSTVAQCVRDHLVVTIARGRRGSSG